LLQVHIRPLPWKKSACLPAWTKVSSFGNCQNWREKSGTTIVFFVKTRKEIAEFHMKMEVRSKVMELNAAGLYPSSDRVEAKLSAGLSLRNAIARATWRRAVKELGFPEIPDASFYERGTRGQHTEGEAWSTAKHPVKTLRNARGPHIIEPEFDAAKNSSNTWPRHTALPANLSIKTALRMLRSAQP
jgi:hypothetical protein